MRGSKAKALRKEHLHKPSRMMKKQLGYRNPGFTFRWFGGRADYQQAKKE